MIGGATSVDTRHNEQRARARARERERERESGWHAILGAVYSVRRSGGVLLSGVAQSCVMVLRSGGAAGRRGGVVTVGPRGRCCTSVLHSQRQREGWCCAAAVHVLACGTHGSASRLLRVHRRLLHVYVCERGGVAAPAVPAPVPAVSAVPARITAVPPASPAPVGAVLVNSWQTQC